MSSSKVVNSAIGLSQLLSSFTLASSKSTNSAFKCTAAVPISLHDYAVRLGSYLYCSEAAFTIAAVYAHRLFVLDPSLFCNRSVFKIMASCVVTAIKFIDDKFYSNTYYAECAGIALREMNMVEAELLAMLGFRVFVHDSEFFAMQGKIARISSYFDGAAPEAVADMKARIAAEAASVPPTKHNPPTVAVNKSALQSSSGVRMAHTRLAHAHAHVSGVKPVFDAAVRCP